MDVTVIVPCYQAAAYLRETLDCLPVGIRAIAVDDASTDETAQILADWQSKDSTHRKVMTHTQNLGLGATRNTGWQHASSEWILFLDADDLLEAGWAHALETYLAHTPPSGWLWHPYSEWDGERKRLRQTDRLLKATDLVTKRLPLSPSGSLIRRAVLEEVGGWSVSRDRVEDIDLWMRLWQAGHRPMSWSKLDTSGRSGGSWGMERIPRPGRRHRSMDASVASGAPASVMVQYSLDEVPHQRRSYEGCRGPCPEGFCTTR
jgi:glycosyltransferase involved in cell wall biosynthesis